MRGSPAWSTGHRVPPWKVARLGPPDATEHGARRRCDCSCSAAGSAGTGKKVSFVSLGCPKNTVDGEVLLGDLSRAGFQVTEGHQDADAIIVNTCGFVEDAKAESIQAILEATSLSETGENQPKVLITGCLAQRYGSELAEELPEADLVMGFERYPELPSVLGGMLGEPAVASASSRVQVGEATVPFRPEWDRHRLTPSHTAYLRVAEGCDHACSFCAIPKFRGRFRSKALRDVLSEAKHLVTNGAMELNLIAEDTNQYGMDQQDGGENLALLLQELAKIEGLHWLRILYAYPSYFSEELIDEIANNPKVCKYIDIPLQHINNLVLLSMNRPPQQHTMRLLKKLRERIPGLALRTTFISGFPGETHEQHRELVDFCKDFRFERMGCFGYSKEDGTSAAELPEQVDPETCAARQDELISLQQDITADFANSLIGQEIPILVDKYTEDGELVGRTQWDAPDIDPHVYLSMGPDDAGLPPLEIGQMRMCKIDSAHLFDLEAHPVC
eukprot:evm.model.scf_2033.1 EVM.evm.TU.scf_2033.1   scf_2033:18171-23166(-)